MACFIPDQLECSPGAVADVTACTEAVLQPDAAFRAIGLATASALSCFVVVFVVVLLATQLDRACRARSRRKPVDELSRPSELSELSELSEPRGGLRGEDLPFPEVSVLQQFLGQAQLQPEAEVVRTVGGVSRSFSREELQAAARSLAQVLQGADDDLGDRVGVVGVVAIFLEPGPCQVAAILGIWMAGRAWTPFDRQSPRLRVAEMLRVVKPFGVVCDDAGFFLDHESYDALRVVCAEPRDPRLFIWTTHKAATSETLKPELPEPGDRRLKLQPDLDSLAQVIYTSGSTGVPKGVVYSHRRLAHSSHFFGEQCGVGPRTKCLQRTAMIWSVFRHEIYPVLCRGGTITFPENQQRQKDAIHLAQVIRSEEINLFVATPTVLELVIDASSTLGEIGGLSSLKHVVCMGEPLSWRLARSLYERVPSAVLLNFYGSTETENATFEVPKPGSGLWRMLASPASGPPEGPPASPVPAGQPQPKTSVYLLDPTSAQEVASGEICFGGVISGGYWGRPDLTSQRFIDHPTHGRLYRTGDLGIWSKPFQGMRALQVLGRLDRQVKIRGARVELEEVEARVQEITLRNKGTESAVVAACGVDNHKVLVAVLGLPGSVDAVREDCERSLPAHMLPSLFLRLAKLPRLANQKADLRAIEKLAAEGLQGIGEEGQVFMTVDSLGMMRRLTRSHLQETEWVQNQQAFWMLVGLLGHFQLFDGAQDSDTAARIQNSLSHNKDMVAFMMLLGVTDSREPVVLGARDLLVLVVALLMTTLGPWVMSPGYGPLSHIFYSFNSLSLPPYDMPRLRVRHDWFLYHYLFARFCLVGLSKVSASCRWAYVGGVAGPTLQALLVLCAACLVPDDLVWLWIPESYRIKAWMYSAAVMTKGLRMSCFFFTGCYLLAFYGTKAGAVSYARQRSLLVLKAVEGLCAGARLAAVCGCGAAAFVFFLAISVLTSPAPLGEFGAYGYQSGWHAVYFEGGSPESLYTVSHAVSWHYMTHPSLLWYILVWLSEMLALLSPFFAIALMMACCPWHLKRMGSTCFGTYVLHPYHMIAPWTAWFQRPVLSRITHQRFGSANILIVLIWNVIFCILFAQTAGACFHSSLVAGFQKLFQLGKRCQGNPDAWAGCYQRPAAPTGP